MMFCKDCKHYRENTHGLDRCTRNTTKEFSPVRGYELLSNYKNCWNERNSGLFALLGVRCGPSGKFWEAKS
jgi:hypothetical protein